ncbi:sigma-70 family RNA polymerase sigma factor [Aeromicrobium sp. UC242_57]|uniref:sigma-70 family RNA polymerase sigma factor n=1 Tax=Aeromicrobium sp. UC242_57 TaxID=3374624 RepID=UPI0037B0ABC9
MAFGAGELDLFERTAVKAAYQSLPERWQRVLWHLDVEGRKPLELADTLGMKANTVSALVYRARTGLREAYLQQHVAVDHDHVARSCGEVRASLAAVVRRTASAKEQDRGVGARRRVRRLQRHPCVSCRTSTVTSVPWRRRSAGHDDSRRGSPRRRQGRRRDAREPGGHDEGCSGGRAGSGGCCHGDDGRGDVDRDLGLGRRGVPGDRECRPRRPPSGVSDGAGPS